MRLLDKYIVYSSVLALFSESFMYHFVIDWKLFYVILTSNILILGYKKKLVVNNNMIVLLLFLFVHGLLMFFILKNPITSLITQLIGISLTSFYYYNLLKNYKTELLLDVYLKLAFGVAFLAIPMFYLNINTFTDDRLNGILLEPAHYAVIMLPAVYLSFRKKKYFKLTIILITILLAKSSIGFLGLLLILFIPLIKLKFFLKYSLLALLLLGSTVYYISSQWNVKTNESDGNLIVRRIKQTNESLNAIQTGTFQKYTNLSSYAFLSNVFISKQIFLNYPLGTGLGSYKHEYEKFYEDLSPPKYLIKQNLSKINQKDANSLFLRIMADLGVFGLLIIIYFIYISIKLFKNDKKFLRQSTFFYLAIKLFREGHYFPPEFYFFLLIFLKDFNEDITHS